MAIQTMEEVIMSNIEIEKFPNILILGCCFIIHLITKFPISSVTSKTRLVEQILVAENQIFVYFYDFLQDCVCIF